MIQPIHPKGGAEHVPECERSDVLSNAFLPGMYRDGRALAYRTAPPDVISINLAVHPSFAREHAERPPVFVCQKNIEKK